MFEDNKLSEFFFSFNEIFQNSSSLKEEFENFLSLFVNSFSLDFCWIYLFDPFLSRPLLYLEAGKKRKYSSTFGLKTQLVPWDLLEKKGGIFLDEKGKEVDEGKEFFFRISSISVGKKVIGAFGRQKNRFEEIFPFEIIKTIFEESIRRIEKLDDISPNPFLSVDHVIAWYVGTDSKKGVFGVLQKRLEEIIMVIEIMKPKNKSLYQSIMEEVEELMIKIGLKRANNVKTEAAQILGINRNTLSSKIKKYKIEEEVGHG